MEKNVKNVITDNEKNMCHKKGLIRQVFTNCGKADYK